MPRTVIALYDRLEAARDAVDALIKNGYTHADISLEAGKADTEGIRSGGTLVIVHAPDNMVDETSAVLNRFNPVNVNRNADARRFEEEGALGEQPINLEAESEVPSDDVRRNTGVDMPEDSGKEVGAQPNLRRSEQGGAATSIEQPGQSAFPPDEHNGSITMQDADRESRRAESGGTPESGPAAGYDLGERGADKTGSPHRSADTDETTGFDTYEPLFRQHYVTSYSHMGQDYEVLRPAYAFGYGLANDPRFQNHEWEEVERNARNEWELTHMDSPWEEFESAIREAWDAVRGWD